MERFKKMLNEESQTSQMNLTSYGNVMHSLGEKSSAFRGDYFCFSGVFFFFFQIF